MRLGKYPWIMDPVPDPQFWVEGCPVQYDMVSSELGDASRAEQLHTPLSPAHSGFFHIP